MKFTFGLVAGIALGAAFTHYLSSREGIALIDKIKEDLEGVSDKISQLAEDVVEKGRSMVGGKEEPLEENIILVVHDSQPANPLPSF